MPEFFPSHVPADAGDFLRGYLAAAEWLLDDQSPPEEGGIDRETIKGWAPAALADARGDCEAFEAANAADLAEYCGLRRQGEGYSAVEAAGHDFWLSRNGHGAGFFDRGNEAVFDRLQKAASVWGGADLYLGDDGFLYFS